MQNQAPGLKKMNLARRKPVSTAHDDLVHTELLSPGSNLPLKVEPTADGVNLLDWMQAGAKQIDSWLEHHGGILFRGFSAGSVENFQEIVHTVTGELMSYTYRSTPRTQVSGKIYTSTEYPADQFIPLHNEMSYSSEWPLRIAFFCVQAAAQGGETPIADSRNIYARLNPGIREQFAAHGVMYVRNYNPGLDVSWQEVFQTSDKSEVTRFCHDAGIEAEWMSDGGLRTRQVCQAVARHPATGEMVWFNQAHLFHVSSLEPAVREALLSRGGEQYLPRNAYYGDGSPIENEVLDEIREAYRSEMIDVSWRNGDLVLLDNMLAAHGRAPFSGARKILVGMGRAFRNGSA